SDFTIDVSVNGQDWTTAATETGYTPQTGVWYEKTFTDQTARYVRIAVPSSSLYAANGKYYTQIAELDAYGETNTASELSVSDATCSSALYNTYVAANATDGNANTFWSCQAAASAQTASLTLDLGSTQSVGGVRALPRSNVAELFPSNFAIQVSTNAVDWTPVASETVYAGYTGIWYERNFSQQSARYVRLAISATKEYTPNGLYYAQIAEFDAYPPVVDAIELGWTAPGASGNIGTAASYEARYSTSEITSQGIWDAATGLPGEPTPSAAGTNQTMNVNLADLPTGTRVYFGIRTTNADANVSGLSNSPYIDTPAAPLPLAKQQMLPGDANGDCSVNLLDIVFIGQRLGQDVRTADNWRADVTGDGRIDVMDQVLVRKHLGAECR
ncbi:MAG: discoidin domain-containing protein, partial [Planctomycetes bacterium]|nr:discoidin domain-containing protein [Planctomycetota bacterium]